MSSTSVDQALGDLRAAIKSIGRHSRVTLVVEAIGEDGDLVHRVERSRMTEDEWRAVMEQRPKGWRR